MTLRIKLDPWVRAMLVDPFDEDALTATPRAPSMPIFPFSFGCSISAGNRAACASTCGPTRSIHPAIRMLRYSRRWTSRPKPLKDCRCLFEPCNLVAAHAEPLRLAERSFATVHTRSVIDHFRAPALTWIESSGFEVDKAHWQAGWNDRVCYIRAQKPAQ